jgi:hypothetical protein
MIGCAISLQALEVRFGAKRGDIRQTFFQNQTAIESIAEKLIAQKRFEPDGSILIRTADCIGPSVKYGPITTFAALAVAGTIAINEATPEYVKRFQCEPPADCGPHRPNWHIEHGSTSTPAPSIVMYNIGAAQSTSVSSGSSSAY